MHVPAAPDHPEARRGVPVLDRHRRVRRARPGVTEVDRDALAQDTEDDRVGQGLVHAPVVPPPLRQEVAVLEAHHRCVTKYEKLFGYFQPAPTPRGGRRPTRLDATVIN